MFIVHAILLLMSYNFWILLFTCVGMAIGNLIFAGLTQDQVLINRVKKEIKIKKVLNQKVNEHNNEIIKFCKAGRKSLVMHWKEAMSL